MNPSMSLGYDSSKPIYYEMFTSIVRKLRFISGSIFDFTMANNK
jgi:hypothetical protein